MHGTRKSCGSLLAALSVHPRVAMHIWLTVTWIGAACDGGSCGPHLAGRRPGQTGTA